MQYATATLMRFRLSVLLFRRRS